MKCSRTSKPCKSCMFYKPLMYHRMQTIWIFLQVASIHRIFLANTGRNSLSTSSIIFRKTLWCSNRDYIKSSGDVHRRIKWRKLLNSVTLLLMMVTLVPRKRQKYFNRISIIPYYSKMPTHSSSSAIDANIVVIFPTATKYS